MYKEYWGLKKLKYPIQKKSTEGPLKKNGNKGPFEKLRESLFKKNK